MTIELGMEANLEFVVGPDNTAIALGSGDVEVLATPQVVAWCEAATVAAVAAALGPNETTVGMRVEIDHLRATPPGAAVRARAVVADLVRRRVAFDVEAHDDGGKVAAGRVVRVVVDREAFVARLADR